MDDGSGELVSGGLQWTVDGEGQERGWIEADAISSQE